MKKIAYIVPYFGKLPDSTKMWLLSCKLNPTVNWILFTDDKTEYDYPKNVSVFYCTYEEMKNRFQRNFDFEIQIDKPWRLCAFRPAFGEIFKEELKEYDFWGHCDLDQIWGDIRHFITDEILERYEKIGFQGHSTLYKNTEEVNTRYKLVIDGLVNYRDAFSNIEIRGFDEGPITNIYKELDIDYYHETNFAHLDVYSNSFFLGHLPKEDDYKNKYQVILWHNGKIYRKYVHNNQVFTEEFMYFHTFMRPVKYKIDIYDEEECYVAYPDTIKRIDINKIDAKFIKKHGKCGAVAYYLRLAYSYRKKLTFKKVWTNLLIKLKKKK